MLEALYNITLLVETGALSYLSGKVVLDNLWFAALKFGIKHDLLNDDTINALHKTGEKF